MIMKLKDLGISGSIGLLAGIALVTWIEPTTPGGAGLILVVAVLVAFVVGGIVALFKGNKGSPGKAG